MAAWTSRRDRRVSRPRVTLRPSVTSRHPVRDPPVCHRRGVLDCRRRRRTGVGGAAGPSSLVDPRAARRWGPDPGPVRRCRRDHVPHRRRCRARPLAHRLAALGQDHRSGVGRADTRLPRRGGRARRDQRDVPAGIRPHGGHLRRGGRDVRLDRPSGRRRLAPAPPVAAGSGSGALRASATVIDATGAEVGFAMLVEDGRGGSTST